MRQHRGPDGVEKDLHRPGANTAYGVDGGHVERLDGFGKQLAVGAHRVQANGEDAGGRAEADNADQHQPEDQRVNGPADVEQALGQPGEWLGGGQVARRQDRQGQGQDGPEQRAEGGDADRCPGRLRQTGEIINFNRWPVFDA